MKPHEPKDSTIAPQAGDHDRVEPINKTATASNQSKPDATAPTPKPKPGISPAALKSTSVRPAVKPSALTPPPQPADPTSGSTEHTTEARPHENRITSDPSAFGRVDGDGNVWLVTDTEERIVGSWQAGDAAEGLAHYGRRYDDLATEVALLEKRLVSGKGDGRKTRAAAEAIAASLPTAAVVGDVKALASRLGEIITGADAVIAEAALEKERLRKEALEHKEALAAEAEALGGESTQWKVAGDRLRAILDEWKQIKGLDRKTDDALWKRYSKARETFNRRRGAHFAELDRERADAKSRKEAIIETAQNLSTSTQWSDTSAKFRDLLREWKAAGRAPRDQDDALWARFKAAQDVFFAARNDALNQRDAELMANATAKEELLAALTPSINPSGNLDHAKTQLRELQNKWDQIGKVPRDKMGALEAALKAVEKKVRDAEEAQWRKTDPEAVARAAQFRDRATALQEQAQKARATGDDKKASELEAQSQQWSEWAAAAEKAIND